MLDEQNIAQLGEELTGLVDGPRKLLLNFQNVEYLSSAAIGKLLALNKAVVASKGMIKICCIGPTIFKIFEITRMHKVFEIHKDEQTALDKF
jgi:anti-sigma B factor antagonist